MVLLNQRIYYGKLSQEERSTTELGTLEFAHGSRSGLRSGITNTNATGQASIIQFSEVTTQADSNLGGSDNDVESGRGIRILVDSAVATGEK